MNINFTKLSPGGNDTVIIQSEVTEDQRTTLSSKFMDGQFVQSEQVGFLSEKNKIPRLDMMGGELCINALRSTATLLSLRDKKEKIALASSGTEQVMNCTCIPTAENVLYTSIELQLSPEIRIVTMNDGVTVVFLEGITHVLVPVDNEVTSTEALQVFEALRKNCAYWIDQCNAFGIIPYWRDRDTYATAPVVCVPATNSIVPETGCGSGSIALAITLDTKKVCVKQPSGMSYDITFKNIDSTRTVTLGGDVTVLLSGTAFIDE